MKEKDHLEDLGCGGVGLKEMRQDDVGNLHTDPRMTLGNTYKCHECVDQQSNY